MEYADTELHEAVRFADLSLVEESLDEGLDPNAIGLYKWSAVHEAASLGDAEILRLLLRHNGDPNVRDVLHNSTPLHYAAKEGHVDCLKMLLEAGGTYDIKNSDGDDSLDLATGKCKALLEKQKVKSMFILSRDQAKEKVVLEEVNRKSNNSRENLPDKERSTHDPQIAKPNSNAKPKQKAWDSIEHIRTEEAVSGKIQLSFEYNQKKAVMKIRVWEIEDLLLPPVEASMISWLYVKSYLLPDKRGKSKRKTEVHRVEEAQRMNQSLVTLRTKDPRRDNNKAVFLPCRFTFAKPLEYKNVTPETVEKRTVHLSVCVKQKFGQKSFEVANWQMPLKQAVRKLRKEKFPLHPCINPSVPDNLHLYSWNDLVIVNSGMYPNQTASNPNLRSSKQSLRVSEEGNKRASSDGNLRQVRSHSTDSIPSVVIEIPPAHGDVEFLDDLHEVLVVDSRGRRGQGKSRSSPQLSTAVTVPHVPDDLSGGDPGDLVEVKVDSMRAAADTRIHMSASSPDIHHSSSTSRPGEIGASRGLFDPGRRAVEEMEETVLSIEDDGVVVVTLEVPSLPPPSQPKDQYLPKPQPKPRRLPGHAVEIIPEDRVTIESETREVAGPSGSSGSGGIAVSRTGRGGHQKKGGDGDGKHRVIFKGKAASRSDLPGDGLSRPAQLTAFSMQQQQRQVGHGTQGSTSPGHAFSLLPPLTRSALHHTNLDTVNSSHRDDDGGPGGPHPPPGKSGEQHRHSTLPSKTPPTAGHGQNQASPARPHAHLPKTPIAGQGHTQPGATAPAQQRPQAHLPKTPLAGQARAKPETTPALEEFRRLMFKRTREQPHPATPHLHRISGTMVGDAPLAGDSFGEETQDPFFVPETPLQSPANDAGHGHPGSMTGDAHFPNNNGSVTRKAGGKTGAVESPAVTRIRQSWF